MNSLICGILKGKKDFKKKKKGKKPEQVVLFLVVTRGRNSGVK